MSDELSTVEGRDITGLMSCLNSMEKLVKTKDEQLQASQQTLKDAESKLTQTIMEMSTLQRELFNANNSTRDFQRASQQSDRQITLLKSQLAEGEEKLRMYENRSKEYDIQLQEALKDQELAEKHLHELRRQLTQEKDNLAASVNACSDLEGRLNDALAANQLLERKVADVEEKALLQVSELKEAAALQVLKMMENSERQLSEAESKASAEIFKMRELLTDAKLENDEMSALLADTANRLNASNGLVSDLEAMGRESDKEIIELRAQLNAMESEQQSLRDQISLATSDQQNTVEKYIDVEWKLQKAESECKVKEIELQEVRNSLENMRVISDGAMKQVLSDSQKDLSASKKIVLDLEERLAVVEEENARYLLDKESNDTLISELSSQLVDTKNLLLEAQEVEQMAEQQNNFLKVQLKTAEEGIVGFTATREKLTQLSQERDRFKSEADELRGRLAATQEIVLDTEGKVKFLQTSLKDAERRFADTEHRLLGSESQLKNMITAYENVEVMLKAAEVRSAELEENAVSNDVLSAELARVVDKLKEMETALTESEELVKRLLEMEIDFHKLQEEDAVLRSETDALLMEVVGLRERAARLEEAEGQLEQARASEQTAGLLIASLREQVSEVSLSRDATVATVSLMEAKVLESEGRSQANESRLHATEELLAKTQERLKKTDKLLKEAVEERIALSNSRAAARSEQLDRFNVSETRVAQLESALRELDEKRKESEFQLRLKFERVRLLEGELRDVTEQLKKAEYRLLEYEDKPPTTDGQMEQLVARLNNTDLLLEQVTARCNEKEVALKVCQERLFRYENQHHEDAGFVYVNGDATESLVKSPPRGNADMRADLMPISPPRTMLHTGVSRSGSTDEDDMTHLLMKSREDSTTIADLKVRLHQTATQLAECQEHVMILENTLMEQQVKFEESNNTYGPLSDGDQSMVNVHSVLRGLENELKARTTRMNEMSALLSDAISRESTLQEELESIRSGFRPPRSAAANSTQLKLKDRDTLLRMLLDSDAVVDDQARQIRNLVGKNEVSRRVNASTVQSLQAQLFDLKIALNNANAELDQKSKEIASMETKLMVVTMELGQQKDANAKISREKVKLQEVCADTKLQLENTQAILEQMSMPYGGEDAHDGPVGVGVGGGDNSCDSAVVDELRKENKTLCSKLEILRKMSWTVGSIREDQFVEIIQERDELNRRVQELTSSLYDSSNTESSDLLDRLKLDSKDEQTIVRNSTMFKTLSAELQKALQHAEQERQWRIETEDMAFKAVKVDKKNSVSSECDDES